MRNGTGPFAFGDEKSCLLYLQAYWEYRWENRGGDFGNGREVRNYFEQVLRAQSDRLAASMAGGRVSDESLTRMELSDLICADYLLRLQQGAAAGLPGPEGILPLSRNRAEGILNAVRYVTEAELKDYIREKVIGAE